MKLEAVDAPTLVQSSHIDLGEALTQHAREAILRTVSKYFGVRAIGVSLDFRTDRIADSKEASKRAVEDAFARVKS